MFYADLSALSPGNDLLSKSAIGLRSRNCTIRIKNIARTPLVFGNYLGPKRVMC